MKTARCPTCHRRHRRTTQANALYWVLLHQLAESLKPNGQQYSADTWHAYCKSRFLGCDDVRLPNGKTLTIPKSSADLAVDEFNEYFGKVDAWAAEHGVFLADREMA